MPGSATDARSARHSLPSRWTWMRPVVRSEETQKKGNGNSSMQTSSKCSCSRAVTFLPLNSAISGRVKPDSGLVVTNTSRIRSRISSRPHSRARPAAMMAPIDVPPN